MNQRLEAVVRDDVDEDKIFNPGVPARLLFSAMDILYDKQASLPKFRVLEVVARLPYIAWEQVSHVAITHTHSTPTFARTIHDQVQNHRAAQDNELYHLLILEELLQQKGVRLGFLKHRVAPQVLAWLYYHLSWFMYVVRPALSCKLNAQFEHHAEKEYLKFVEDNPEQALEPWNSQFTKDYGDHTTVGELLTSIANDERHHKLESLTMICNPRFGAGA